jgi:phosphoribosylformylglycinamidine cyclo-ligase
MAEACNAARCALLGGETAEMPGVYAAGEVDVVGTIVGAVDRDTLLDGSRIQPGDVLIGLASSGLHTNGFTLARAALDNLDWSEARDELGGQSIGETFLSVHRSYLRDIEDLRAHQIDIRGLAHITGGGIVDNLPRILPDHAPGAIIERGTWPVLPVFKMIQQAADVSTDEMYRVFNMGLGMLVIVPAEQVTTVTTCLPDTSYVVGRITDTPGIQFEGVSE